MNFFHCLSSSQIHGIMRGASLRPFPTLCPTPNLISHGILTLYGRYGRPLMFRLSTGDCAPPDGAVFLKMGFGEGKQNSFTLKRMAKREEGRFLKDGYLKGSDLVFWLPKVWEGSFNRPLAGGMLVLAMDGLATLFRTNLIPVIDAQKPHNAELYPNASLKLEPVRNTYVYANVYLQGYRKRMAWMNHPQTLMLIKKHALAALRGEEAFLLALEDVTRKVGELVRLYGQGQVPEYLEAEVVQDILALPKGSFRGSWL